MFECVLFIKYDFLNENYLIWPICHYLQEKANAINFFELLFFLENFLLPNLNKI